MKMGDILTDLTGASATGGYFPTDFVTAPVVDQTSTMAPQTTDSASAPSSIDWTKLLSTGLSVFGAVSTAQAQSSAVKANAQAQQTIAQTRAAPYGYTYNAAGQMVASGYGVPSVSSLLPGATSGTSSMLLWGGVALLGVLLVMKARG